MKQRVSTLKRANASAEKHRNSGSKAGGQFADGPVPSAVHDVLSSPGIPLNAETRSFFEPRFGFDLSRVRVHADPVAAATARTMGASAYTVGQHIAFDSGKYETHSQRGLQLIAHELAHTVQQNGASRAGELRMGSPTDASEKEADRAASMSLSHRQVAIHLQRPLSVQRQPSHAALPELDPTAGASPMMAAAIGSTMIDQFETGKSDIPASRKGELSRSAKYIVSLLGKYPGSTIQVTGHTDAVGKDADNQSLGQSRADSVRQALVESGVTADAIQTDSRGASSLLVKTKAGDGRNRSVQGQFRPARQFPGILSSHLSLGAGTGDFSSPAHVPTDISKLPPEITQRQGPPYGPQREPGAPPDAFKSLPSDIPWELMDISGYNDAFTSHGTRSDMDDTTRATWAALYRKYFALLHDKKKAAAAANWEMNKTAGQDQSRDNPNTQDQFNQDWKNSNPNDKSIGPFNIPFLKKTF